MVQNSIHQSLYKSREIHLKNKTFKCSVISTLVPHLKETVHGIGWTP